MRYFADFNIGSDDCHGLVRVHCDDYSSSTSSSSAEVAVPFALSFVALPVGCRVEKSGKDDRMEKTVETKVTADTCGVVHPRWII